jgi:hypothetical protein
MSSGRDDGSPSVCCCGDSGRGTSITLILVGSIYYTWVKHVEGQKKETLPSTQAGSSRSGYEPVPMDDLKGRRSVSGDRPGERQD